MLVAGVGGGLGGGGWGLGQGSVDGLVEEGWVHDLGPVLLSYDEDRGGLGEAYALAEGLVGLDLLGEEAGGIYDEGHVQAVLLEPGAGVVLKVVLAGDGGLGGEDVTAVVLGGLGGDLVLEVAGGDGGVEAPDVHLEGEVVADEWDVVFVDGCVDDGEGAGAGGALEVFELVDRDAGSCGWLDHGGIAEGVGLVGWQGRLRGGGMGNGGREESEEGGEEDGL